jgi:ribonuclease HII
MPSLESSAVPCPYGAAPTFVAERFLAEQGFQAIAGIDEVGRGCLAGPVVACAIILPVDDTIEADLDGVRDSKDLTAVQRERLASVIRRRARAWGIGLADAAVIDQHNILHATRIAMQVAIQQCQIPPDVLLLDAIRLPAIQLPQHPFIKGDRRSLSIAAASILAKVTRDALMETLDVDYPAYGFAHHKGYGTATHLAALRAHGPCPLHRRSFAPVKAIIDPAPEQGTMF